MLLDARRFNVPTMQQKLHMPELNDAAKALIEALQRTNDASLDTLLELRPDITEVGKRLIAALVLEYEFNSPARYPSPKDDWITTVFGELTRGTTCLEDFGPRNNPIVFITYNYDRLLEYRLSGALASHYGRPMAECIATLKQIPIVHLHGDPGALPGFDLDKDTVPFGPRPGATEAFAKLADRAAQRIVIVHEAKEETGAFEQARHLLQSTEQIVMLGFGYGEKNLARLQPRRWRGHFMGTVFGLNRSQIEYAVRKPFRAAGHEVAIGEPTEGTREFLDNRLQIFRERG